MASISRIMKSLQKRNIALTSHEVNVAILYSSLDSIYYRLDGGKLSKDEALAAIDKAVSTFQQYEQPTEDDAL